MLGFALESWYFLSGVAALGFFGCFPCLISTFGFNGLVVLCFWGLAFCESGV